MLSGQTLFYLVLVMAAASAILAIEALYISFAAQRAKAGTINRRLRRLADEAPAEQTLQNLLRERGLTADGNFAFGAIRLNQLYTQSGITGNPLAFALSFFAAGVVLAFAMRMLFGFSVVPSFLVFLAVAFLLPLLMLAPRAQKADHPIRKTASRRARHDRPLAARRPSRDGRGGARRAGNARSVGHRVRHRLRRDYLRPEPRTGGPQAFGTGGIRGAASAFRVAFDPVQDGRQSDRNSRQSLESPARAPEAANEDKVAFRRRAGCRRS